MKKLLILFTVFSISCLQIDREYKHLINTWQLFEYNSVPYNDVYQWSFKRDGTMIFANGSTEYYNYDVIDGSICIEFNDIECVTILRLTKDELIVHRQDADITYKFISLN